MALRIETQAEPIPGYRLLERLGSGGFGEVWKCEAPGGLLKAIKIVQGADPLRGSAGLAEQELKALRRVQSVRHPYLLSIDRHDVIDGRLLIVMELADGSLWDRFRERRANGQPGIPREELLRYLLEAAEVLDLMHGTYQLQHLDIKPQNLFLIHDHVKVGDFGLVKDLQNVQGRLSGGVTPFYAAPETFDGVVSRHCDQYSLAIVYQELLTGMRPVAGDSVQQVILQHLQGTPNLTSLPGADRPAVARALGKKPEDRYPSCLAFVRSLRAGPDATVDLGGPIVATVPAASAASSGTPPPGTSKRMTVAVDTRPTAATEPAAAAPRPERTGDGVLVPAVVVGLGGTGRAVLQRLRQAVVDHVGPPDRWPHLRLLYLDTDPEAVRAALDGSAGPSLAPDEVLPVRLQRAGHYLKPRADGRPITAGWFDSKWLNRLSRQSATQGSRGLGRLAFADHFRALAQKLEGDLAAAARPDALERADRATGLGLRSDRPRVIVVANLAGGTGGGLFLDLAYLARHLLRRQGHPEPDVAGWLLVPPAGAEALAAANAYAALTELHHFSQPQTTYRARCDDPDGALSSRDAPFGRLVVLPLAAGAAPGLDGVGLAADGLLRELLTPLGRAADDRRAAAGPAAAGAECRTFGLARYVWPRRATLTRAARRLAQRLLERWTSADPAPVRAAVEKWVGEQWAALELGPEPLARRLRQACAEALGRPPDELFAALTEHSAAAGARPGDRAGAVLDALVRLEEVVGRPADDTAEELPGLLARPLARATDGLLRVWGGRLTQLAVCLIEQPDFRLAGAEAALHVLRERVERALAHFGPLGEEWLRKGAQANARIHAVLAGPGSGGAGTAEVAEALRIYPRWRYHGLVLRQVAAVYGALRGQLDDELGEVGLCREQLTAALAAVRGREGGRLSHPPEDAAGWLLPDGCRTLDEAVERLLGGVTREDLRELDRRAQQMVQERAGGLARACLELADVPQALGPALVALAEEFLEPRLGETGAAEAFLARHPSPTAAGQALADAWASAAPPLAAAAPPGAELTALALSGGPASAALADEARRALAAADPLVVASPGDVALVRERSRLPLAALPQLGPEARAAYRQLLRAGDYSPHARADVAEWAGVGP